MIFYILLIAYLSPIFAGNEIVKPPLEASRPMGSVLQPLPQMNIDNDYAEGILQNTQPYNIFSSRLGNIRDISQYCPHTDIISRLINTLSNQPHGDAKIRAVLANYYNLLTNALNQRQNEGILNNYVNDYKINDINSLAQNILMRKNNNVKVKISFQYELPEIQRNKCEQLCKALEKYANVYSGIVNYDYDRNTFRNDEMLVLQNQRPLNIYPNYPSNLFDNPFNRPLPNIPDNYLPNLEPLLNPQNAKLPNLNRLQELFPPLPNPNSLPNIPVPQDQNYIPTPYIQTPLTPENSKYEPANNLLPLIQNPTNSYPVPNLGPSLKPSLPYWPPVSNPLKYPQIMLPNPTENSYPLQDIYPQNNMDIPGLNPLQYLQPPIQDLTKPSNDNIQQLLVPEEPYPQFSPSRIPSQLNINPTDTDNSNPLQNILPLIQNQREPQNFNPLQNILLQRLQENNLNNLQNLERFPQNPNSDNSISIPYLPSPPTNPTQPINYNPLQNLIPTNPSNPIKFIQPPPLNLNSVIPDQNLPLPQQNDVETDLLQNLSQSVQSYSGSTKSFQEYVNSMNQKYIDIQNYQNQNSQKNYDINLDLTKYRDQESDISSLNRYNQNDMLLNQNQIYDNVQQANSAYMTENPVLSYLANLNSKLDTNVLSNINQQQSTDIKMDSLSESQSNRYNYYNQYTDLNNGMYQREPVITNPYYPNNQVSTNNAPSSIMLNRALQNALYNSYQKNLNQLQRKTYNRFLQMPNSYYNTNFNIANVDKTTQNYNVQLEHLHRLLAMSNLYKLNSAPNKNGVVELTYKLRHYKPIFDPYYYVKYRLPYEKFLYNLKNVLWKVPNLRNSPNQDILLGSNVSEASKDLKKLNKDELFNLIASNGTLVTAKLIEPNNTDLDENIKIVQGLNANIPLYEIVKTNANAPQRYSDIKTPLDNYMRAQEYYKKHLQNKLANSHNSNPFFINAMSYNQNRQRPNFLTYKKPQYNPLMALKNPAHVLNNYHPRNIL